MVDMVDMVEKTGDNRLDRQTGLTKKNCQSLKGILAILILVHHLYQHSGIFNGSVIGYGLQALGYFVVAVFFFLSGYGLTSSYTLKGKNYLKTLPKRRILPLYIIEILLICFYTVEWLLLGHSIGILPIVQSFLFGNTIVANGWYIQVQLMLYILFVITFLLLTKKKAIVAMGVECVLYIVIAYLCNLSATWYVTILSFFIGILWNDKQEYIDKILGSKLRFVLITVGALAICLGSYVVRKLFTSDIINSILLIISSSMFTVLIASIVSKISVCCKLTEILGKISLEIYVMQGAFLVLFHSGVVYIENAYLYVLLCLICTIAFSFAVHPINKAIYAFFRK